MFSERLKDLRKAQGLTREQVGKGAGLAASSIGNYERGDSAPDVPALLKLCGSLHVSADYLLGLTDDPSLGRPPVDHAALPFEQQKQIAEISDCLQEIGRRDQINGYRDLVSVAGEIVHEILAAESDCEALAEKALEKYPVLSIGDPLKLSREERIGLMRGIASDSPSELIREKRDAQSEYREAVRKRTEEAEKEIQMLVAFGIGGQMTKW